MDTRKDYVSLNGKERVAVLMMALQEDRISQLFESMEEEEIREIALTMSKLGKISSNTVEAMFAEFIQQMSSTGALVGTFESTKRLLSKALSKDRVESLMEEISGPAGRTMWDKLSNISEDLLASYLRHEYPQTIAVVLTRIRPEHASKVLALLPDSLTIDVINRILRMDSVRREILDDIERTLRNEFMNNIAKTTRKDPYATVAEIFNYFDRSTETKLFTTLEAEDSEVAERIKNLMFTFDDMIKIDSAGIQMLIRVLDKNKLAIALKGASDTVKDLFFENMSERAGKIMKEEMEAMGLVRVRDVDDAQTYVVATAKELSSQGEIYIRIGADAEDELIS